MQTAVSIGVFRSNVLVFHEVRSLSIKKYVTFGRGFLILLLARKILRSNKLLWMPKFEIWRFNSLNRLLRSLS
ncbi:UNVERIFIED_CONTAM: hypothetical protein Slati_3729300 [Sesamum latifolium]|uniref:Uncharacterized protein n=1 Tax=Sesamum latifolium TaxID=2727402 RepID=A0AAW2U267_9LAMI